MDITSILSERDKADLEKSARAAKGKQKVTKISKKELQIREIANNTVLPDNYYTVWTVEDLDGLCTWLSRQRAVAIDTETTGLNPFKDSIVGLSLYAVDRGYYIPLKHEDKDVTCLPMALVTAKLKAILEDADKKWILHNTKFDEHVLRNWLGIRVVPFFDTLIAQALLDENQSKKLKDLAAVYLGIKADKFNTLFGKVTFDKVPIKLNSDRTGNLATYYAVKDAEITWKLSEFQMGHLMQPHLSSIHSLFFDVEMPFIRIVTKAEERGIPVDKDYLENKVAVELHRDVENLRQWIKAFVGDINLNSPAQLSKVLYDVLKLPKVNEQKPFSTDKKTMQKLKGYHEVISLLIAYRQKVKLVTAFADKLPKSIIKGRLHTNYSTVGPLTGRMSSSSPNLQQIPIQVGGLIRNAFLAEKGRLLASFDFSQQEIRVLAHISQDPVLLKIFKDGMDVHSMTATGMWNRKYGDTHKITYSEFEYNRKVYTLFIGSEGGLDDSKLTDTNYIEQLYNECKIYSTDKDVLRNCTELGIKFEKLRRMAKVVNFGIIYGMSKVGLADTLEISRHEAEEYIAGYFDAYPGVKKWIEEQREFIRKNHFTQTLLKRKRRVYPDMRSTDRWVRERGYRRGINAIIQGSSADMTKLASIKLQPLLAKLDSQILLWVHDELVISVPENIEMKDLQLIADVMCNALPLSCGMKVDIELGKKWGQKLSEDDVRHILEKAEEIEEIEGDD